MIPGPPEWSPTNKKYFVYVETSEHSVHASKTKFLIWNSHIQGWCRYHRNGEFILPNDFKCQWVRTRQAGNNRRFSGIWNPSPASELDSRCHLAECHRLSGQCRFACKAEPSRCFCYRSRESAQHISSHAGHRWSAFFCPLQLRKHHLGNRRCGNFRLYLIAKSVLRNDFGIIWKYIFCTLFQNKIY